MEIIGKILLYDGTFNGFLTTVFKVFEEKIEVEDIQKIGHGQSALFTELDMVETNLKTAKRVWEGLSHKNHTALKNIYFAFLSEQKGIALLLYQYIRKLYALPTSQSIEEEAVVASKISQAANLVRREKIRLESQLKMHHTNDEVYVEVIKPSFNVLPLISKHFRTQYGEKEWIIYDAKRDYGIHCQDSYIEIIELDFENNTFLNPNRNELVRNKKGSTIQMWNTEVNVPFTRPGIHRKIHAKAVA
jgi:probable DNA metabolism protein